MSEDHRFLPFFLREPVYVVDEPEKPLVESASPLPVAGLGKKGVLVLVHAPEYSFLSPADQGFLEKILGAVGLSSDDISLINWAPAESSLAVGNVLDYQLPGQAAQTILVFGEVPQPWSRSNFFEKYAVKSNGTQRFLQADPLATLPGAPDQKLSLWKCLQQLFPQP